MATSVKLDGREEKREALKQEALRAWEAYQENGLHLTLEEADAWLAKLEAGEGAELPKYHQIILTCL